MTDRNEKQEFRPWVFAGQLAFLIALGLTVYFIYAWRTLVLAAFLGIILAVFWSTLTSGAQQVLPRWVPRSMALFGVIIANIAVLGGVVVLLVRPLGTQIAAFVEQLPAMTRDAWMRVEPMLRRIPGLEQFDPADIELGGMATELVAPGIGVLGAGAYVLVGIVTVLFLGLFLALSPDQYAKGLVNLFPLRARDRVQDLLDDLGRTLRLWMQGTALAMLSVGGLVTVLLFLLGVEYALLFGVLAGLFELVPYLGPIIAFIGPMTFALAESPQQALAVLGVYLVVQTIEGNLIVPYFMQRRVALPPVLTVIAILAMAQLFGFLGIFLAVPTLAVLLVFLRSAVGAETVRR